MVQMDLQSEAWQSDGRSRQDANTATTAGSEERGVPARPAGWTTARWARIERGWWVVLGVTMLVFSAFPIANLVLGFPTKDYGLWYQVGTAVRQGLDVYPRPESDRLFPFMYPPSAAAMLAWVSMLGRTGSLLAARGREFGRLARLDHAFRIPGG